MIEESVSRSEYIALMRMLVRRATLADRYWAWRRKGHWLNAYRRELLIEGPPTWLQFLHQSGRHV